MTTTVSTDAPVASRFVRLAWYVVALAPVLPMLALRELYVDPLRAGILAGASLIPIAAASWLVGGLPHAVGQQYRVTQAEIADDGFAGYALGFLLPVALVDITNSGAMAGLLAFLGLFGVMWINSNLGHQNPVLALLGWHCWKATLEREGVDSPTPNEAFVITNVSMAKGVVVMVRQYDGPVWYAVRRHTGAGRHQEG